MIPDAYQQALDYIFGFADYERLPRSAEKFDLRRMEALLERLGKPHLAARTVHIAGTKGKGSTAAMIASALTAAGYRTGLYTSPHLIDARERVRIDSRMISKEDFADAVEILRPEAAAVNKEAAYGKLTTFELLTVLAFVHFRRCDARFQVLETGLGGRLDATNVARPEVAVITSISLDHTEVLGKTLAAIAREKAGIIKPGSVVVSAPQSKSAAMVIEKACLERGTRLIKAGEDITWENLGIQNDRQNLVVRGQLGEYRLSLPLLGLYQQENAAVAVAALEALAEEGFNLPAEAVIAGLDSIRWPGRFQVAGRKPAIVLDGAHNPYSARQLARSIRSFIKAEGITGQSVLVFGTSIDKDAGGMAAGLNPLFDSVIITRSQHPRAMATEILEPEFEKRGIKPLLAENVHQALETARRLAGESGLVCVTGSLFVVGEAMKCLSLPA